MSCALQRACAKANIGTSNNGVPTYKIRSRQLLRIHRLRLGTVTGTAGTVWGRENALTCCIGLGRIGSLKRAQKSTPLHQWSADARRSGQMFARICRLDGGSRQEVVYRCRLNIFAPLLAART